MKFALDVKKNTFPDAPAAMRRAIGRGFEASRAPLLADMQRRTPVDTGALRASESVESDDQRLTLRAGTDHALYVHQGTRRMTARPFMRDAAEAGMATIVANIAAAAEDELG
jgi:hypothetical protein